MGASRVHLGALLALALLAPTPLAWAAHGSVHVAEARVGDQAIYALPGATEPAFGLEWLPPEPTVDRWGEPLSVDVLRTLLPPGAKPPDADRDWVPSDDWAEYREAFAGKRWNPVWRLDPRNWNQNGTAPLLLLQVGLENHANARLAFLDYAPPAALRSCLAHHGLQGRALTAQDAWTLGTVCPAVGPALAGVRPLQVRGTSFLGRAALEFHYALGDDASWEGYDLQVPAGASLRFVLADGLPFVAEAEVAGEGSGDGWRYVLSSLHRGEGPLVQPWLPGEDGEPAAHRVVAFQPLGPEGPADGASGLPYALEDALAAVRTDATLSGFQAWLRGHPEAFVLEAHLAAGPMRFGTEVVMLDRDLGSEGEWTITFASPRRDGVLDTYAVASRRTSPSAGPLGGQAPEVVHNAALGPGTDEGAALPPGGLGLDIASAVRVFREQVPEALGELPVAEVAYAAPREGAPPTLWVLGRRVEPQGVRGQAMTAAEVLMDASTGSATRLGMYRDEQGTGPLNLRARPLQAGSDVPPPLLPESARLSVLTLTAAAVLAGVLMHAGYATVMYSRLRQSDLLENPLRRRAYDLVRTAPGVHFQALAAHLDAGIGGAAYHLRVLERGGLLTSATTSGYRRYYLTGTVPFRALPGVAELDRPGARALYEAVRQHPGVTLGELAAMLSIRPPSAHNAVERLRYAGLVEKRVEGRLVRLFVRDPAHLG